MLEKPKLFIEAKEFWLTLLFFLLLLSLRLFVLYHAYVTLVHKPFYFTHVEVQQQYEKLKGGKRYTILRVYSPELDLDFFTRTQKQEPLLGSILRLKLYPSQRITFWEYCSTSFISSHIVRIQPKIQNRHDHLAKSIAKQHENPMMGAFYQAIFLAMPLSKELRDKISSLGVSHLVALSGFHLGILSGLLFLLLRPLYRWFQQRYFPYRFDLIDIGLVVLLFLGVYVYFVGSPASLLRSYVMMLLGWLVLIVGIELLSFDFLLVTTMLLLLIFPKLLFSLAFYFSVMGVFYIFLLLHYFRGVSTWGMSLLLSFSLFVLMMPLVHVVFPLASLTQFYSPFLSLLFSIFYPLSLGLHVVGFGDLLDEALLRLFSMTSHAIEITVPWFWAMGYVMLSVGAIYWRKLFYGLFAVAFGFVGWIFIRLML